MSVMRTTALRGVVAMRANDRQENHVARCYSEIPEVRTAVVEDTSVHFQVTKNYRYMSSIGQSRVTGRQQRRLFHASSCLRCRRGLGGKCDRGGNDQGMECLDQQDEAIWAPITLLSA